MTTKHFKHWQPHELDFLTSNPHLTTLQIAAMLGRTRRGVRDKIARLKKAPHRKPGAKPGEAHHKAVLTEVQVLEIRRKHAEGATYLSLYEEYPVQSMGTICAVISRRTWKHI